MTSDDFPAWLHGSTTKQLRTGRIYCDSCGQFARTMRALAERDCATPYCPNTHSDGVACERCEELRDCDRGYTGLRRLPVDWTRHWRQNPATLWLLPGERDGLEVGQLVALAGDTFPDVPARIDAVDADGQVTVTVLNADAHFQRGNDASFPPADGEAWAGLLGPCCSSVGAARLLGLATLDDLDHLREEHGVLGLLPADANGEWVYPAFQFDASGRVKAWLPEVLLALDGAPMWGSVLWLTQPHPDLDGQSPIDAGDAGIETQTLVNLARQYNQAGR